MARRCDRAGDILSNARRRLAARELCGERCVAVVEIMQSGVSNMDKDRIKGMAERAKGKVKEWSGKVTGDTKTEVEGKSDQIKGKVQNAVGGLKDAVRGK
jgi:uncharacterized protein YjbJ (UPF0337 family)